MPLPCLERIILVPPLYSAFADATSSLGWTLKSFLQVTRERKLASGPQQGWAGCVGF